MAPRIALVCAPPHRNPGMYSVDLAFDRVLDRAAAPVELRRYSYGGPYEAAGLERHRLHYASLEDELDEVLSSEAILFWGDFQHALSYWRTGLRRRPGGRIEVADEEAEAAHVADHLLLRGQPEPVLAKTLSFGTSLLGDDISPVSAIDAAYQAAFPAFAARTNRIWCRDPVSAARVARFRPERDETCLGVDAALLLTADDYRSMASPATQRGDYAGIFFGRLEAPLGPPASLAAQLTTAAGLEPVWIPWLERGGDVPPAFAGAMASDEADTYEALLGLLAGARLVVTDAYHLCLIAWRLGIPAVCVGIGAQRATRPVSDKKKEVFHLALGLSPLYVFHESLGDASGHPAIARGLLDLALDPTFVSTVSATIGGEADAAEARLWSALGPLLS